MGAFVEPDIAFITTTVLMCRSYSEFYIAELDQSAVFLRPSKHVRGFGGEPAWAASVCASACALVTFEGVAAGAFGVFSIGGDIAQIEGGCDRFRGGLGAAGEGTEIIAFLGIEEAVGIGAYLVIGGVNDLVSLLGEAALLTLVGFPLDNFEGGCFGTFGQQQLSCANASDAGGVNGAANRSQLSSSRMAASAMIMPVFVLIIYGRGAC